MLLGEQALLVISLRKELEAAITRKNQADEHVKELEELVQSQTQELTDLREANRSRGGSDTGHVAVVKLKRRLSELEAQTAFQAGPTLEQYQSQMDEQARQVSRLKMEKFALEEELEKLKEQSSSHDDTHSPAQISAAQFQLQKKLQQQLDEVHPHSALPYQSPFLSSSYFRISFNADVCGRHTAGSWCCKHMSRRLRHSSEKMNFSNIKTRKSGHTCR